MRSIAGLSIAVFSLTLLTVGCQGQRTAEMADLVLTNAYVYTVDDSRSVAEAVAVRGPEIIFVGSSTDALEFIGDDTVVRDMDGAMVMPGLHDMHIHALGTVEPDMCDLKSEPLALQEMVPVVKACIAD